MLGHHLSRRCRDVRYTARGMSWNVMFNLQSCISVRCVFAGRRCSCAVHRHWNGRRTDDDDDDDDVAISRRKTKQNRPATPVAYIYLTIFLSYRRHMRGVMLVRIVSLVWRCANWFANASHFCSISQAAHPNNIATVIRAHLFGFCTGACEKRTRRCGVSSRVIISRCFASIVSNLVSTATTLKRASHTTAKCCAIRQQCGFVGWGVFVHNWLRDPRVLVLLASGCSIVLVLLGASRVCIVYRIIMAYTCPPIYSRRID